MKQKNFLLFILMLFCLSATAQKQAIYVTEFTSRITVPDKVTTAIRSAVIESMRKTNRVAVIDALSTGADRQLDALENARYHQAAYLLNGDIVAREATDDGSSHRKYHSRADSFKEKFVLQLELVRTSDNTIVYTGNYDGTGSASGKDATQLSAVENALLNMPYEMGKLIDTYFKVYGSILNIGAENAKKVKTVYINLGFDDPIKEGIRFDVIEENNVSGETTEECKIGEIRVDKMVGPRLSLCKVNKGGDKIKEALQKGLSLKLVSRQAKLFDE